MYEKEVKDVLEKAGWYEGRKIDISQQIDLLKKCKFEVFDVAVRFLEEYDNLKLIQAPPIHLYQHNHDDFNVVKTIGGLLNMSPKTFEIQRNNFNIDIPEKTIPIGGLTSWEMTLFLTETGRIITDWLVIGNTIEEGVTNVINGKCCGKLFDK